MTKKIENMVGKKFNRWLILAFVEKQMWSCLCDCGTVAIKNIHTLKSGGSKSCGCLRREVTTQRNKENNPSITKHGMTGTPEWSAFKDARNRCNSPKNKRYKDYGGRGIKFLFDDFEQFFSEIGLRPSLVHSLDRKDNEGNYESGNIQWSLPDAQAANRRQTFVDLTGLRFGRLLVLSVHERLGKRGSRTKWRCVCDCGNETIVAGTNLKNSTKSCGCLRREATSTRMRNAKH
jgi:hypothetical protein